VLIRGKQGGGLQSSARGKKEGEKERCRVHLSALKREKRNNRVK